MARTIEVGAVSNLVLYSIPAFIVLMLLEGFKVGGYERRDTIASLSMGGINVVVSAVTKLASIPFFGWLYEHRVADLGGSWWSWVILLFAEDCCYSWFHRLHHEI